MFIGGLSWQTTEGNIPSLNPGHHIKLILIVSICRKSEGIFREVRAGGGGDGDEGPHHQALQGVRVRHLHRHGGRGESHSVWDS